MKSIWLLMCCGCLLVASAAESIQDRLMIEGESIHCDFLEVVGLTFTDVVAFPQLRQGVIHLDQLHGKAYQGTVNGAVSIGIDSGDVEVKLQLVDLQLGAFLSRFADVLGMRGVVNGQLTLRLPQGSWEQASGSGELILQRGAVLDLPAIALVLLGKRSTSVGTDEGYVRFSIANGTVHVDRMLLDTEHMVISGGGTISPRGHLRITMRPVAKLEHLRAVPAIGDIARWLLGSLTKTVSRIDVRGSLSDPRLLYRPFQ